MRRLRALGWVIPPEVSDDSLLRVYDTRLEPSWTKSLVKELGPSGPTFVVGGDFMTSPHLTDSHVVSRPRVTSWGPAGQGPCHFFVPPRPHQAEWLGRAHQQLSVEAPGSEITVACIVPRGEWSTTLEASTVRRLLPASAALL